MLRIHLAASADRYGSADAGEPLNLFFWTVDRRRRLTEGMKRLYHGKVRHVKQKGCVGNVAIYIGRGLLGRVVDREGALPAPLLPTPGVRSRLRRVR
jgi:hypothetical protein